MRQLLPATLLLIASAPVAAGTTAVTGATIDTQGFEAITIIAHLGAITATGTPTLKAAQGEVADGSDKADLAGSAVAATDAQGNMFLVVQIHRPKERYITPVLLRPTANAVVNSIIVLLHGASNTPVAQTAVAKSAALNSPAEGAA